MLIVTNNGEKPLVDSFDGKQYRFLPGVKVAMPESAAEHIFGYGREDKLQNLIRLGWCRNSGEFEAALAKLDEFEFHQAAPSPDLAALEADTAETAADAE